MQAAAELLAKGVARLRSGELDLAQAAFEAAGEISESGSSIDGLGCVAFRRGQLDEAARHFEAAMKVDGSYSAPMLHLAMVEEARGNLTESRRLYEAAVKKDPRSFKARNNFAVFLHEHGSEEESARARHELRKAYVLEPNERIAVNLEKIGKEDD